MHTFTTEHIPLEHYTDHFISIYYPYKLDVGVRPSLYYAIDGEEPIFAKIRSFEIENSRLNIYFIHISMTFLENVHKHYKILY